MNNRIPVSIILLAVLLLGVFVFIGGPGLFTGSRETASESAPSAAATAQDSPSLSPAGASDIASPDMAVPLVRPETLEAESIESMKALIADLEASLEAAIEVREAAEAELDMSETDVAELEKFVDEIEARGDDPVDYADEGLEKFQPAFYRYQEAFAVFEQAELLEQGTRDALNDARRKLAALQQEADGE